MTFLTNWVFWAIVIVIIILLAIIGYLAEGTTLGSKNKKKQPQTSPKKDVEEIEITEENNAPSAWTGEIKKDERHEQVHDVPSVDDWSTIPTEIKTPSTEETLNNENIQDNNVTEQNQINPSILENLDAPLTDTPVVEEVKTQPEITVQEPVIENMPAEMPKEETMSTLDATLPELNVPEANLEANAPAEQPAPTLDTTSPEPITSDVQEPAENKTLEPSPMIEPAPIFDAPVVNTEPEILENLEVPKEEEKQKENVEDIWK